MRSALLIAGQARCVKDNYNNLKEQILDRYPNIDVYINTWDTGQRAILSNSGTYYQDDVTLDEIREMFNPKTLITEKHGPEIQTMVKQYEKTYRCYHDTNKVCNLVLMHYQWRKLADLFNPDDYDFVIKYRFDMSTHGEINPEPGLCIPIGCNHLGGISDVMAYGNPHMVHQYLQLFDFYPEIYAGVGMMHAESMLRYYLMNILDFNVLRKYIKIKVRDIPYNVSENWEFPAGPDYACEYVDEFYYPVIFV